MKRKVSHYNLYQLPENGVKKSACVKEKLATIIFFRQKWPCIFFAKHRKQSGGKHTFPDLFSYSNPSVYILVDVASRGNIS